MLSDKQFFSSENLNTYLKELGKEFRRLNGTKMPAEIILVGGAAILVNYQFREKTTDIDALIYASSAMKEAINRVGDKYNLPNGWLNSDFSKTDSYSPNLKRYSQHYREYSNVLEVRTISAEYLIAMKLVASRPYRQDLSDVASIILEHKKNGNPIYYDDVIRATMELYGKIEKISSESVDFLRDAINSESSEHLEQLIIQQKKKEQLLNKVLIEFDKSYANVLTDSNCASILESLITKGIDASRTTDSHTTATKNIHQAVEEYVEQLQQTEDTMDMEK